LGFKIHAARRRTRVKTCLPSADDHVGATARLSRSLSLGPGSLLGCVIVWEGEVRGSATGDRTFGVVSTGAAAFTAAGVEHFPGTAEKVMAGFVTGVGFLGAGMIFRDGDTMRGLALQLCGSRRPLACYLE
jgi:putative Mg2+ transporter-C (MgtC) family protein